MELINKLLYRRFSKEEYKQILKILSAETRVLLKRPQYIIGNFILAGLVIYFVGMAFGTWNLQGMSSENITILIFGFLGGGFVSWLLIKRKPQKVYYSFLGFWIDLIFWWVIILIIVIREPGAQINWMYLIYAVLTFLGWGCSCNSIKEHLCERIFTSQKNTETSNAD